MVSPRSVYDYSVADCSLELRKVQEIPSGYDAALYATERLEIEARDGTKIPASVVYPQGSASPPGPLHLYGYGAYGIAIDPAFRPRASAWSIAASPMRSPISAAGMTSDAWYKAGKLEQRTNTFNDFVDVAKGLIERGYTGKPGRISTSGGSAGGELMGAVINSDPGLWGAVVADVPFVDVLNTMLDASLPLTPGEWPGVGQPDRGCGGVRTDPLAIRLTTGSVAQAYPPMLVTAGLNDPRVTYWEPAKWVARLRELKTDSNELLLKTNMGAGHGGKSGRFESLKEVAEEFAFILWQLGTGPAFSSKAVGPQE